MERLKNSNLLQEFSDTLLNSPVDEIGATHFLNGAAAAALRKLIPLRDRRNLGAFFTPQKLAEELAAPLADIHDEAVILDPCCGAGDLLLASLRSIAPAQAISSAHVKVRGTDIVREFTEVALARLHFQLEKLSLDNIDINVVCRDGLNSDGFVDATHIVVNPPFGLSDAPSSCSWTSGRVNKAALFIADILPRIQAGASLHTILPDVLRCGTRYARWRRLIEQHIDIESIKSLGRFDRWTDVDVFIMSGQVVTRGVNESLGLWTSNFEGKTVGDLFRVSVGSVVNYRDPQFGPCRSFLTAKSFPTWDEVKSVTGSRKFQGKVESGPFVAIPRTSSPNEPVRSRGAIIIDGRPIAVDNHILVVSPHDGRLESCRELLEVLKQPATTTWLNNVNRCRHLTIADVESIPWINND